MRSSDDRQSDEYACRLTFMHINALSSVDASAHECTQFSVYPFVPIDAGLDYTYFEVARSICEAAMAVSLTGTHADS